MSGLRLLQAFLWRVLHFVLKSMEGQWRLGACFFGNYAILGSVKILPILAAYDEHPLDAVRKASVRARIVWVWEHLRETRRGTIVHDCHERRPMACGLRKRSLLASS